MSGFRGCSGTCCTGVGSDPCTCLDREEDVIARVEAALPDESERVKYGLPNEIAFSDGLFKLADDI